MSQTNRMESCMSQNASVCVQVDLRHTIVLCTRVAYPYVAAPVATWYENSLRIAARRRTPGYRRSYRVCHASHARASRGRRERARMVEVRTPA